jgi:hypothetical protein
VRGRAFLGNLLVSGLGWCCIGRVGVQCVAARGDAIAMTSRARDTISPGRPTPSPWVAGIVIGMTITTLATAAMMLGVGLAVGQAINRGK